MTAFLSATILRLVAGEQLPDFMPVEESRKPGFILGMAARISEELIFRLVLLPLVYKSLLQKKWG